MCVCVFARERESERKTDREDKQEGDQEIKEMCVCTYVRVCICLGECVRKHVCLCEPGQSFSLSLRYLSMSHYSERELVSQM